ncbi:hypothetical protein LTR50_007657 [Elasticomyces elasticus]|nr:hypothetical protein LTR50_007657 [Elasticomyces elasticus]
MAATGDYAWTRASSIPQSPDTVSPVYPERPIRPLPKRRLRSKLSPEQAGTIVYPPDPPASQQLFNFPYSITEKTATRPIHDTNGHSYHYEDHGHSHCHCGGEHSEIESDEDEIRPEVNGSTYRYVADSSSLATNLRSLDAAQRKLIEASRMPSKPPPPDSTASSADGYESFENTSNKKKRKIPLSSTSSVHQSNLSAELANMGISSHGDAAGDDVNGHGTGLYYGSSTPSTGTGISGAGRGRFGRQVNRNERRPLGAATNAMNGYTSAALARGGDTAKQSGLIPMRSAKRVNLIGSIGRNSNQGVISAAIASAAAQSPSTPQKGKENVSLLSQQDPNSAGSNGQFTFEPPSDPSKQPVTWPGQNGDPYAVAQGTPTPAGNGYPPVPQYQGVATQGTQTTPSLRGPPKGTAAPPPVQPAPQPARPRRRRRPSKEFERADRTRRMQQEYTNLNNYHKNTFKENLYICEFCEYEDIFGTPPRALIRQYEIKDRQERKKAAEKRRLLEKAKAKNRKGKKGGKNNKNAAAQPPPTPANARYDQTLDNMPPPPDVQGDDYLDDDYDDEIYEPEPTNSLDRPIRTKGARERNSLPAGVGGGTHAPAAVA